MDQRMMRQVQEMQKKMLKAQEDIAKSVVEASVGGGVIVLKMTGKYEIVSLDIDKEVVDPEDVDTLRDLLIGAMNEAVKKIEENQKNTMSNAMGGMQLPPGFM